MILQQRFVPGLAIASYLIGDETTGEAAVVDPTRDVDELIRQTFAGGGGLSRPYSVPTSTQTPKR